MGTSSTQQSAPVYDADNIYAWVVFCEKYEKLRTNGFANKPDLPAEAELIKVKEILAKFGVS